MILTYQTLTAMYINLPTGNVIQFQTLQLGILQLPAEDPYLIQPYSHVHDGCQQEMLTFRNFTVGYITVIIL